MNERLQGNRLSLGAGERWFENDEPKGMPPLPSAILDRFPQRPLLGMLANGKTRSLKLLSPTQIRSEGRDVQSNVEDCNLTKGKEEGLDRVGAPRTDSHETSGQCLRVEVKRAIRFVPG